MSKWKEYILEDVIDKFIDYRGKTPIKTNFGIPLITARIVKDGRLLEANEFIAEEDYESRMTRGFPEINDVVLTTEAPLGEVALIKDKNVALGQRIITLQTKKEICNSVFLKYYLQSREGQASLQARASGSTVEGIKSAELKKMEVFLPDILQQTEISNILISLDDKIDLLHTQNKTIDQLLETIFRQWFIEEADDNWKETALHNFISVKHGFAFKGNYISTEPTNYILVTPGNFKIGGGFKFDKFKYYVSDEFPKDYIFQTGDLAVTMTDLSVDGDTLGCPALIPDGYCNQVFLHNQRIGKVQLKTEISKHFIFQLMKTPDYQWFILGGASGTAIRHTSPTSICAYAFKLPPKSRLLEFELVSKEMEEKIRINQNQIRTLTEMRDALIPKLMNGEAAITY
ncbi:MAG: restriction endonuclease subunit S [Cyclobacteriaceae bacterium]|nr:restriction endonuclease subunit S [Cyclobacteriaceae bacterium]